MFFEIMLSSLLIMMSASVKKKYLTTGKKTLFGHFTHYFMNRDMYEVYDQEIKEYNLL